MGDIVYKHTVFAYGTLIDKLGKHSTKIEAGLTCNMFMGSYGPYKALRSGVKVETHIGHIIKLSDNELVISDRYEGYPYLYTREEFDVVTIDGVVKAWVYFIKGK